eukprot:96467-Prymnesium_polylepis.1
MWCLPKCANSVPTLYHKHCRAIALRRGRPRVPLCRCRCVRATQDGSGDAGTCPRPRWTVLAA